MKKIAVSLLLTIAFATSCMELQEFKKRPLPDKIVPTSHKSDSDIEIPLKTIDRDQVPPLRSQSQKLIAHHKSPSIHHHKKSISDTMEKLYSYTLAFVCGNRLGYTEAHTLQNKNLITLINNMYIAFDKGIHEDTMGLFASEKIENQASKVYYYIPLIFNCLKKYRLTTSSTQESLPSEYYNQIHATQTQNDPRYMLAQLFDIAPIIPTYPAYIELSWNLSTLFNHDAFPIKNFTAYLYNNKKTVPESPAHGYYQDLKNDVYQKAMGVLNARFPIQCHLTNVYDLLQIADNAKKSNDISPTNSLRSLFLEDHSTAHDNYIYLPHNRKQVALFCLLIENYNKAKGNKITPTIQQYSYYQIQKKITCALPEFFDKTLFDENYYAFDEFTTFIEKIAKIKSLNNESNVQYCIDQLYPQGK